MASLPSWIAPAIFTVLSLLYAALSWRDYHRTAGKKSPARRVWTKLSIIFGIVAIGLLYLHWRHL